MNIERDKFLTEAMGECFHDWETSDAMPDGWIFKCKKCSEKWRTIDYNEMFPTFPYEGVNFSIWENFGKLWEWSQKQEWWGYFIHKNYCKNGKQLTVDTMLSNLINPDKFADAVYEYLKEG